MNMQLNNISGNNQIPRVLYFFVPIIFLVGATFLQIRYDDIVAEDFDIHAPVHRSVAPAPVVSRLAFGFQNVLADYYWITAVQALNKWDRKDTYFPEYFRIIASLDPKFEYPYFFATLVIPNKSNPDSLSVAAEIATIGMTAMPENWEIPFYMGMQYHIIAKSHEQTIKFLEIAAAKSGSPDYVRTTLAIHLMRDSTEYQRSRALFSTIYETSENEETKRIATERIMLLDFVEVLTQASMTYKRKTGAFPSSVNDLIDANFVQLTPELIRKFKIRIDKTTGEVNIL